MNRIVEISNPAYLRSSKRQLLIQQKGELRGSIPFEDLHVIILCHPQITVSQATLQQCLVFNVPLIVCDEKHLPTGFLYAPVSNSLHSKLIRYQAKAKLPLKKRLWKAMVFSKVTHQGKLLIRLGRSGHQIIHLSKKIRSGDPDNFESQAASLYWMELFGKDFRRDRNQTGINALLNYGYSILRASTARALAGCGLNCALGVFHHNQYNPFCLADDLMEMARPLVDEKVWSIISEYRPEVTTAAKAKLLDMVNSEVGFQGNRYFLTHALQRSARSLAEAFLSGDHSIFKPLDLKK